MGKKSKSRRVEGARPGLSCVMIVKDEAAVIVSSVTAARRFADEVVVVDTGSTDDTAALAALAGARVEHMPWPGGFAAARNAAAQCAAFDAVLFLDADEVLTGAPPAFRRAVAGAWDGERVELLVVNAGATVTATTRSWKARVYDRRVWEFAGAVHEFLVRRDGAPARPSAQVPAGVAEVLHSGYADPRVVVEKARRNAALAQAELDAGDLAGADRARMLLHVGRSWSVVAEAGGDSDLALVPLREALEAGDPVVRRVAADVAVSVLLAAGRLGEAAELIPLVEMPGTGGPYVAFLSGLVLLGAGHAGEAVAALTVATSGPLVSGSGHTRSAALPWKFLSRALAQTGDVAGAAAAASRARALGMPEAELSA